MLNEVIHDVLYALHQKQSIPPEALTNDFEKKCKRLSALLRWVMLGCFALICGFALCVMGSDANSTGWATAASVVLLILMAAVIMWTIVDALPTIRDLSRFDVYTYQVRQLEAAHDLQHAADLERFGLPALSFTEKWLTLRIERIKLRLGMAVGGSDKVAVLAILTGAWAVWHNFPRVGSAIEQYMYLAFGMFLCGSGIGGIFANALIARLSYQRDLLALSICRLSHS